jgi:hypothetical protein
VTPRTLAWLAVFLGLILVLSATPAPGWVLAAVVAVTLVLAVPLGVKRYRVERNLARAFWRTLTSR